MAKLPRAAFAQWLSFDKENWTLLGKDNDSISTDLGPNVETNENVLGETSVEQGNFVPEVSLDSYKARTEDAIYEKILDIAMGRKTDEESTTAYLLEAVLDDVVKNSDSKALSGRAWLEECTVVPQSYGGDTTGFDIPINLKMRGGRVEGTVSVTKRVPTFTPKGEASGASLETQTTTTKANKSNLS